MIASALLLENEYIYQQDKYKESFNIKIAKLLNSKRAQEMI